MGRVPRSNGPLAFLKFTVIILFSIVLIMILNNELWFLFWFDSLADLDWLFPPEVCAVFKWFGGKAGVLRGCIQARLHNSILMVGLLFDLRGFALYSLGFLQRILVWLGCECLAPFLELWGWVFSWLELELALLMDRCVIMLLVEFLSLRVGNTHALELMDIWSISILH
jgi:hypothetical protein